MAKQSKLILLILLQIIFIAGCANQLPPGGGELDKVPPQIVEIYPANGTTNFHEDYFEITFSEYVEKRSVQEAIFISPLLSKGLEYDWSGKSLTVYFKDTLKTNTTYTVTIGAETVDLNNRNKMTEPVTFAFSTGAQIDSGKIDGKVFNDDPSGVMVYAYRMSSYTTNPLVQKPDYISQVGKNGKYTLLGLSRGQYQVFAIRDKFRDFKYNKNDDEFGVQSYPLVISDSVQLINNTDYFLEIEDTISPSISNVYMRDRNHFLVEFNEPIDSTKILAANFYLYDSTANKKITPKYFFRGDAKGNQFYLAISDSLTDGNQIYFFGENIFDKSSNKSDSEGNSITVKNDKDTTAPKIIKIAGTMPEDKVDYDMPVISVKFDDGFDHAILQKSITISDAKGIFLPFDILTHDNSWFDIKINSNLKPRTDYTIKLNLGNIFDAAGNKVDSIYSYKFTTVNDLDFSGVSGVVLNADNSKRNFVVLQSADKEKKTYKKRTDARNIFNIEKVLPGKYLLWSFKDNNSSNNYDNGKVYPFEFSEEFKFYPDTLNLRPRWPVGDISINFK